MDESVLPLMRTEARPCPYLGDREASEQAFLCRRMEPALYQELMDGGYRRSGRVFYRPDCGPCRECRPIRVPVAGFKPSHSQRRVLRRNAGVRLEIGRPVLDEARLELHNRYQAARHGKEEQGTAEDYARSFLASPIDTLEMGYWSGARLVGIGIVDACPLSLSSVYFYFDPGWSADSPGVYSGLCEIELCRQRGLPYWYLGFLVRGCRAMEYKAAFRPYEILGEDGAWRAPEG